MTTYALIDLVFSFLYLALFVRILLSWIPHDPYHPVVSFLYRLTDPMLKPFQNLMPVSSIGIDISPIFAFIALGIIKKLLLGIL